MLTLTIQGISLDEIQGKIRSMVAGWDGPALQSTTLASGATLLKDAAVAAEEIPTPKKRGPKPKEAVTVEPAPVPMPADAKVAVPSATFESMKKALQELAGKHKTNEEGMTAVSKLLLDGFGIKMVRDVPADKYQAVQDAAIAAMGSVGSDPFKV
jgi:hypothetical protein